MNDSVETVKRLEAMARRMRVAALDMALAAGRGGAHLGGGLSCIEILAVLYGHVLRYDAKNPFWEGRDRFLASKNHCVLAQFPALHEAGYIEEQELMELTKDGGRINGYPMNVEIGLEYSGGSLGMAISVGVGMALALREDKKDARVYVLMGDGELHEGSIWEAFMSAAHYGLGNLCAIIDRNRLCYDGDTEDVMALEDLGAKMRAFNWHVSKCDGHSIPELLRAFDEKQPDKPHIIIADTIKGKGVSFMENKAEWHHGSISQAQYDQAIQELEQGGLQ